MKECSDNMSYGANAVRGGIQRGRPSRRAETEYCERKYHRIDSSMMSLIGCIPIGIFVWWLLRGVCIGTSLLSIDGMRIKEILNVAMNIVPYFLGSRALIHIVIIIFAVIQVGRLRSRM